MANQIAANFEYLSDREEAAGNVAGHIRRFWDPQMRTEIVAHLREGADDLSPIARRAIELIAETHAK